MVSLFNFYLGGNDYVYSTNYCNVTKHVSIYHGTYLYLVRLIKKTGGKQIMKKNTNVVGTLSFDKRLLDVY
jgi:hypothetical protein